MEPMSGRSRRYPAELKERAVRMVLEHKTSTRRNGHVRSFGHPHPLAAFVQVNPHDRIFGPTSDHSDTLTCENAVSPY